VTYWYHQPVTYHTSGQMYTVSEVSDLTQFTGPSKKLVWQISPCYKSLAWTTLFISAWKHALQ